MKKILFVFIILFAFAYSTFGQNKRKTKAGKKVTTTLISENLADNWHVWRTNETKGWKVEDGILTSDGKQGDLLTNKEYGDFLFEFSFKIAPKQNSGIIYKVIEGEDTKIYSSTYLSGPEYQIIDDANYPSAIKEEQKTGANYDIMAPMDLTATKPAGEWNTGSIEVKGNHITHKLNGIIVSDYQYGSPEWKAKVEKSKFKNLPYATPHKMGKIALQGHGGKIWFKDLKITN